MWDGDDFGEDKGATPKQRLMNWIKSKIPELPINNFTSDWNDGRAVGALVDAVAPGLCPDWQDWNPNDAAQNAAEAMGLADDWLNIPQVYTIFVTLSCLFLNKDSLLYNKIPAITANMTQSLYILLSRIYDDISRVCPFKDFLISGKESFFFLSSQAAVRECALDF